VSGAILTEIGRLLAGRQPAEINDVEASQAAVALIVVPAEAGVELLLIKRAQRPGDPWSGQMGLPGGRRDATDPSLLDTAKREAREETGVDLVASSPLGQLDDLHPLTTTLPPIVVRPFVFGLHTRPRVVTNDEVDLHLWANSRDLSSHERQVEVAVRGERWSVTAFDLTPHAVWGMTHRIIRPFLDLVNSLR
jgi:8-oxo-dGTP pyrophosphatase MutT (NUDIX family)